MHEWWQRERRRWEGERPLESHCSPARAPFFIRVRPRNHRLCFPSSFVFSVACGSQFSGRAFPGGQPRLEGGAAAC